MATIINTKFSGPYLSADLPDEVEIESLTPQVTVTITINEVEVYSSPYYIYGLKAYVRDIRSIVEAAMLQKDLAIAKFLLTVKDYENFTYNTGNVIVIYSHLKSLSGSEQQLTKSFLSTRKSALLSRSCPFSLYNYAVPYMQVYHYCYIYYTIPSSREIITATYTFGNKQSDTPKIIPTDASYAKLQELLAQRNILDATIHRVYYYLDGREFNIYFTPDTPSDTFQFKGNFNLWETVCLFGATTSKMEIDRSEAVCGNKVAYYDTTVKVKHEVETAPLTLSEAQFLTQLLSSQEISREVADGLFAPVIISDISSEVSDNNSNPIRLKFTWTYADQIEFLP
jgi:hypothetical protein